MKKHIISVLAVAALGFSGLQAADIVATVNGQPVTKEEMTQVLKMAGADKNVTWDKLDKAKKEEYVRMLAPSKVMAARAQKELTQQEKEGVLAGYWMQKKMQTVQVSDKELKEAYQKIKDSYIAQQKKLGANVKQVEAQFPPFEMLKPQIESKLKQDKLIDAVMKDVKIEIK